MSTLDVNDATLDLLRDAIIEEMKDEYHLVYVQYDDRLNDDQIQAVAENDWERLNESIEEWHFDVQGSVASDHVDWLATDVLSSWLREGRIDEDDLVAIRSAFGSSDQHTDAIIEIEQRDVSDPIKDLARQSDHVLMRQLLADEGDWWSHEQVSAMQVLVKLDALCGRPWTGVAPTFEEDKHNLKVIGETLNECSPEFSTLAPMIVYAVNPGDLYELGDADYVEVEDPHLYLGNPFAGDGMCSDEPLRGIFRIKRSELTTDTSAFGYGWAEVCGGVTVSAYESNIAAVKEVLA